MLKVNVFITESLEMEIDMHLGLGVRGLPLPLPAFPVHPHPRLPGGIPSEIKSSQPYRASLSSAVRSHRQGLQRSLLCSSKIPWGRKEAREKPKVPVCCLEVGQVGQEHSQDQGEIVASSPVISVSGSGTTVPYTQESTAVAPTNSRDEGIIKTDICIFPAFATSFPRNTRPHPTPEEKTDSFYNGVSGGLEIPIPWKYTTPRSSTSSLPSADAQGRPMGRKASRGRCHPGKPNSKVFLRILSPSFPSKAKPKPDLRMIRELLQDKFYTGKSEEDSS